MRGHFECAYFGLGPMRHHFGAFRHHPFGHGPHSHHGPHGHHGPHCHHGPHDHHGPHGYHGPHGHHGKHGPHAHGRRGHFFGPCMAHSGFGRPCEGACRRDGPMDPSGGPDRCSDRPFGRGWGRGCHGRQGSPGCGKGPNEGKRGRCCNNKKDQGTQALVIERVIVDNENRCNSV